MFLVFFLYLWLYWHDLVYTFVQYSNIMSFAIENSMRKGSNLFEISKPYTFNDPWERCLTHTLGLMDSWKEPWKSIRAPGCDPYPYFLTIIDWLQVYHNILCYIIIISYAISLHFLFSISFICIWLVKYNLFITKDQIIHFIHFFNV